MIARLPPFPSYRSRYLPAMTPAAIAALPDKARAPVILATGAIEQHGPHLPVAVDAFLGQVWVSRLIERLAPGTPCYVAPPITIGKSNEHTGYPGTLILSRDLLRRQVLAIARQLKHWGFRTLAILNTHGGNTSVLAYTLREVRFELGLQADLLRAPVRLPLSPQESAYGFHANQFETAALLALAPQYTHLKAAVRHYPASLDDPGELRPEGAPATFAWASQDLSPSGIMGDAPAATAADGHAWVSLIADAFAAEVTRLANVPVANPPLTAG
jgi:creatinine amidohydrolase